MIFRLIPGFPHGNPHDLPVAALDLFTTRKPSCGPSSGGSAMPDRFRPSSDVGTRWGRQKPHEYYRYKPQFVSITINI